MVHCRVSPLELNAQGMGVRLGRAYAVLGETIECSEFNDAQMTWVLYFILRVIRI